MPLQAILNCRSIFGNSRHNYLCNAAASTKYENTGAVADLFKPDKTLISKHLFLQPGRPSFTQINQNTGETIGFVTGTRLAAQDQEPQPDDGEHQPQRLAQSPFECESNCNHSIVCTFVTTDFAWQRRLLACLQVVLGPYLSSSCRWLRLQVHCSALQWLM